MFDGDCAYLKFRPDRMLLVARINRRKRNINWLSRLCRQNYLIVIERETSAIINDFDAAKSMLDNTILNNAVVKPS